MSINFWDLLHQRQDELTKSGRAVADYLLQHADGVQCGRGHGLPLVPGTGL